MQENRRTRFQGSRIHKGFLGTIIAFFVILLQLGEGGQARIPEKGAAFVTYSGESAPATLTIPLAMTPLPIQESFVASLPPPSRPIPHPLKTQDLTDHRLKAKQRLGLALFLLGMLAENKK